MKRFALNIICFLPLAALAVALLLCLLGGNHRLRNVCYTQTSIDFLYYRGREVVTAHDVDVLFLGSSHAYRTFDPRTYAARGVRVFNLGSSNQTPVQTEVMLRCYLDTLRPRLVVFEVHPDILSYDGIESVLEMLCTLPPSWPILRMALATRNLKVLATAIYAIPQHYFGHDTMPAIPSEFQGNRYVSGGYVESDMACYSPAPIDSTAIVPLPSQLAALGRCLAMLRDRGIPVLLLEVPDTRVLMNSYSNLNDFHSLMGSYGDFYFKTLDCLDDSLHFYDSGHLNQCGVDLYGSWLCDSLIIPTLNTL